MYDIRQFRPALFTLLVLGISGFALASESPGLWVMAVGAILLNAWLTRKNLFRPMPRLLANLVTIIALGYVVLQVMAQNVTTPILIVGQFLVLLQIVKLYEQRANRDYAQLLVLSLLLIVAAAISTASMLFGILLIAYLFLSLYVCLLFHLKVETDYAKQAIGISEERINPATLRQDQRYMSRSMRRLTGFVSSVAVGVSVLVFIFFPRGSTGSLLGPLQFRPAQTLTGFTDQPLSFQQVARITQNPQIVAYVTVTRDDEPIRGTMPLLLRGKTLQVYTGKDPNAAGPWQWIRTAGNQGPVDVRPGGTLNFARRMRLMVQTTLLGVPLSQRRLSGPGIESTPPQYKQRITLDPTGTPVLFALGGIVQFTPQFDGRIQFSPEDHTIISTEPLRERVIYEVVCDERMPDAGPAARQAPDERGSREDRRFSTGPSRSSIDPRIEQLVRDPQISGAGEDGPLVEQRDRQARVTPLDLEIAGNIERYLRANFLYTLDLTDASRAAGEDPMVAFLTDFKRGHCEYFAGAMTLMCQSLGLQARVVIGFRTDEYNEIGRYYIVRQSHAHAWVEVLGDDGLWHSFDPTSGRSAPAAQAGVWRRLRHLFNFLEFTWASSIVAYDRESRTNIINSAEQTLVNTASAGGLQLNRAREWLTDEQTINLFSFGFVTVMIYLMGAALMFAVIWYIVEQWRLRRRARRIGLGALPRTDQLRLARQLGFYDELLRLLERRRIRRPRHLTPLEFCQTVSFLPSEAFQTIRRLTEVFYRVRFGGVELSPRQRNRLHHVIDRLEDALVNPSGRA